MGLTLITERSGSGANDRIREHLAAGIRAGRESVLVLPTFVDVRRAREELAASLPVGVDVTTFGQWLESLWRRHGDGRTLVSSAVRQSLARQACADAGETLGAVAKSRGFAELIAHIASRAAGLTRQGGPDAVTREVLQVLERYEAMLEAHDLIEGGEATRLISQGVAITGLCVAWSRFTNLSTTQEEFIKALARQTDLLLALTWERGFPATEALDPTVEELAKYASSIDATPKPAPRNELDWIEQCLYRPQEPLVPSGQVTLSEAAGLEAEAALVAAAAARAIADGFEPERVVVAFRELAARREFVAAALCAAQVPFAVDLQMEFRTTPLGSALLALARVVTGGGGREPLLHFLRGPFSDAGTDAVAQLDERWRKYRVEEAPRLLRDAEGLSATLSRVMRLAQAVCRSPVTEESAKKWQEMVVLMLSVAAEGGTRDEADLRLDVAAHGLVVETAGRMAASGVSVSGDDLLADLAHAPVSSGTAERAGAVQVTEVQRVRSRSFDVVILGGLTAAEFSSEKREPLVATLLRRMGLSEGMDERLAERMLFYLVITRARERLELVRQSCDAAGNALRPSVFWEEVCDLYRTPEQTASGAAGRLGVSHVMALGDLEKAAPAFARDRTAARASAARGELSLPGLSRGMLSKAADVWPQDDQFSVTEIEDYLACPYRWFYSRVVRPSEVDRAFDARSRGSYAHALISRFYADFRERGHARVTASILPDALALFAEVARGTEDTPEWQTRGLGEELAAATAREWVRSAIEQDADILVGFEPTAHEWAFGAQAGEPFVLGGVKLKGKVDRVDLGAAGVTVTDYKSSAAVHGQGDFEKRRSLQAVIYACAAAAAFEAVPVAGVYRSFPTRKIRGFWDAGRAPAEPFVHDKDIIGPETLTELVGFAEGRVVHAVEGIRAGRIEPDPADRQACEYCGVKPFCAKAAS